MKRLFLLLLCLAAVFALSACQGRSAPEKSALEIAEIVLKSQPDSSVYKETLAEKSEAFKYAKDFYGIDGGLLKDAAVICAEGLNPQEIAVFRLSEEDCGDEAADALYEYIKNRYSDFSGYAPREADIVKSAEVVSRQGFAALLICTDTPAAKAAFRGCFESAGDDGAASADLYDASEYAVSLDENGYVVFDSSGLNEMAVYDSTAVLAAYRTGDASGLSEKDAAVLRAAADVLSRVITCDMTEYEKEHAVHDYMITHADYDKSAIVGEGGGDCENPYGFLIEHSASCMGYASTFSLFMDMLGIENMIISGAHAYSAEEHAWNMVNLGGEWYCVDATWDDPIDFGITEDNIHGDRFTSYAAHKYFNVTDEFMRDTDHQWDYYGVPKAEGTEFAFDKFN
ncbi:MAG: DUF4358 domain-containing protein [Clostridia bacterium]|nr:DUF4358 domain-containing protein [Clostridia bacterium]